MSIWSDYKGTRFKVDACLGQGGMGAVYRAYDNELRRQVAIKVLKKSVVDKPSTKERFIREALCLSRLSHPNIVKIFSVEEEGKCPYLIQEYLKGRDLQSIVKKEGSLPEEAIRSMFFDVASALACMHEANIFHRDLKPSNIFITEEGRAVVLDFGLSLKCDQTRMTQEGMVLGTAMFMTPETLRNEDYCAASDIYQLGLVVHYALTGKYLDRSMSSFQLDIKNLRDPNRPTPEPAVEISDDLREAISLCCQKIVQNRPVNGSALVMKLKQIKAEEAKTELLEKVEAKKESKASLKASHFLWLMLFMALFALYARYEEKRPVKTLSLQAKEQRIEKGLLLFPNGFFWTFRNEDFIGRKVKKGKTFEPQWRVVDGKGASRQGKFRKFKGAWVADCNGLPSGEKVSLFIVDGENQLFRKEVTIPRQDFDIGLRLRRGVGWVHLSWNLPVKIPIDIFIGAEFGDLRCLGSFTDECHFTGKEVQNKFPMRYRLALGDRTLANGSTFPGFRHCYRLPKNIQRERNAPNAILYSGKDTIDLLYGSEFIVSLKHTETSSGAMMVPQWSFHAKDVKELARPSNASRNDSTLLPLSDELLDVVFGEHRPSLATLYRGEKKERVNKVISLPGRMFEPLGLALPDGRFVIAGHNEESLLQVFLGMADGKVTKLGRLIACSAITEICWEGERLYLCCWQGKRVHIRCFSTRGNEVRALWAMPLDIIDFREEGLKMRNVVAMGPRPGGRAGLIVISGSRIYCYKHKGGSQVEASSLVLTPPGKLASPTIELTNDTVGFFYVSPDPHSVLSMYEGRFMWANLEGKPKVEQSPQVWSFTGNVRKSVIARPYRQGNKIISGGGLCVLIHMAKKPYPLMKRLVVPWGVRFAFMVDDVLYVLNDEGVIRGIDMEGFRE